MADRDTGQSLANDPNYVRRLDRSPEKIIALPEGDKKLVFSLRSAIQGAHSKMQKLRDDVDDRDRTIDKEKSLRKSLEDKLEKSRLVDMYNDPTINDELHDRLPRAHSDRKYRKGDRGHHSDSEIEERIEKKESKAAHSSRRHHNSDTMDDSMSETPSKKESRRHRGSRGHHKSKSSRSRSHESFSDESYHTPGHRSHYPSYPQFPMPYGAYPPPPGHMSYASPPHTGYVTAYPFTPPQHAAGFIPQPFAPPTATSTPTRPQPQQYTQPHHQGEVQTGGTIPSSQTPSTPANQNYSISVPQASGGEAAGNALRLDVRRHSDPTAQPDVKVADGLPAKNNTIAGNLLQDISNIGGSMSGVFKRDRGMSSSVDQSRQIALLLKELDAAKDLNIKLSDRLYEAEKEVEAMKLQQKTKEVEIDERISGRAGELVAQIYQAQKERDAAVMGRLRLANEERDEALARLERLQKGLDESGEEVSELIDEDGCSEVGDMLSKIAESESSSRVRKQGKRIVDQVQRTKGRRKEITAEEMQAILEERDAIMAKAKQLEQEVLKLRKMGSKFSPDRGQEKAMKAKLMATQQERDMALAKVRRLEDELQNLRVYYSLHKSLSQEASLRDQFNNSLENLEEQLKERDGYVSLAQKENNKLLAQLKTVIDEKAMLQQEMEKSRNSQKEANANCEKLERLVNVLRRKVNGLGTKADD